MRDRYGMKRGLPFDAREPRDTGVDVDHLVRPAKVYRSVHANQLQPSATTTTEAAMMIDGGGGGERRNGSSDSDGSGDMSTNLSSSNGNHHPVDPVAVTFLDADMVVAFADEGKCRVCLWPRASTQCYH